MAEATDGAATDATSDFTKSRLSNAILFLLQLCIASIFTRISILTPWQAGLIPLDLAHKWKCLRIDLLDGTYGSLW
jgi:hypothetical protein